MSARLTPSLFIEALSALSVPSCHFSARVPSFLRHHEHGSARSHVYTRHQRDDGGVAAAYNAREKLAGAAGASKGGLAEMKDAAFERSHGAALVLLAVLYNSFVMCASTKSKESVSATRCQSCDFIWRATRSDFFPTRRRESPWEFFKCRGYTMLDGIRGIDRVKNISFSSESLEIILDR